MNAVSASDNGTKPSFSIDLTMLRNAFGIEEETSTLVWFFRKFASRCISACSSADGNFLFVLALLVTTSGGLRGGSENKLNHLELIVRFSLRPNSWSEHNIFVHPRHEEVRQIASEYIARRFWHRWEEEEEEKG